MDDLPLHYARRSSEGDAKPLKVIPNSRFDVGKAMVWGYPHLKKDMETPVYIYISVYNYTKIIIPAPWDWPQGHGFVVALSVVKHTSLHLSPARGDPCEAGLMHDDRS